MPNESKTSQNLKLSYMMDDHGEVSQILSGITFNRNNVFDAEKSYL